VSRAAAQPAPPYQPSGDAPYSRRDRAQYLTLLALCAIALTAARLLEPSPRGVGTHEQLGLPPCLFLKLTGLPCPSCGLTTSFAHAARLHFYEALVTQPFGLIACAAALLLVPTVGFLMHRRVPWARAFHARATNRSLLVLLALYLSSWAYKIAVTP
jgi:hypothetical protein